MDSARPSWPISWSPMDFLCRFLGYYFKEFCFIKISIYLGEYSDFIYLNSYWIEHVIMLICRIAIG